jgi:competence protein ComGC
MGATLLQEPDEAMTRMMLALLTIMLVALPATAQQEVTVSRDGDKIVVSLADGTSRVVHIDHDAVFQLLIRDGEIEVIEQPSQRRILALAHRGGEGSEESVDIELGSVLEQLPDLIRDRIEGIAFPRVRVEVDMPTELRREIAQAERESRHLALLLRRAVREGDTAAAQRLRTELTEVLQETFALHQQAREVRLTAIRERQEQLAREAEELAVELETREQLRGEIIERRRQELTEERAETDW